MREDLIKILKMYKDETINIYDAADFIETLYSEKEEVKNKNKKYLRVIIEKNNKKIVNMKIPLSVLKISKGIIRKSLKNSDLDKDELNDINEAIDNLINSNSNQEIEINTEDGQTVFLNLE
ncbi:MAG: hypothetical protein ACQESN_01090 [Thermotogota bacterium]